jgi:hypothetical protein
MLDDLHPDDLPEVSRRTPNAQRPPTDREVPLGPPPVAIADSVHAWLDGEESEGAARRGDGGRDVELWRRLEVDVARRRRLRTPPGLEARVMAAIAMLPR